METIKNYLDNMFANLPKTEQMLKLKNDILSNMEDKYNELKSNGKSENEAIGIVISEFGNIDELISELGLEIKNSSTSTLPTVTEEEAIHYMSAKKASGLLVGIGVFLCILAPAILILFTQIFGNDVLNITIPNEASDIIGLIPFFIFIAIAVALFIMSGMKLEKYKYIEEGFYLPVEVKNVIEKNYADFSSTYTISVIIGVCLCILSPISIFISSIFGDAVSVFGIVIFLTNIAVAVFFFIYFGCIKEGYSKLLEINEFTKKKKEEEKVIGAVASVVWPLAVCIFLVTGLIFNMWHINWIIFPVTGILFGAFSGVYNIVKGKEI